MTDREAKRILPYLIDRCHSEAEKAAIRKAENALQERIDRENKMQKPMTNADRIRAMSDEELTVFLDEYNKKCTELEKVKAERDKFEQMYLQSEVDATNLIGELTEVSAENAMLRRERDAAVRDLKECDTREPGGRFCKDKEECYQYVREHGGFYPERDGCPSWQWRGPDGYGWESGPAVSI